MTHAVAAAITAHPAASATEMTISGARTASKAAAAIAITASGENAAPAAAAAAYHSVPVPAPKDHSASMIHVVALASSHISESLQYWREAWMNASTTLHATAVIRIR
ncbi:hypothetical protein HKM21_10670 [Longimicrobium terrae]|nr:hypothetical protein [Longimicrobium terrae]